MLKRFSQFLTKKAGFLSSTRKWQQEADALRVLILTEYRRRELAAVQQSTVQDGDNNTTATKNLAMKAYTMDELLDNTPVGDVSMREWLGELSHSDGLAYNQQNLRSQVVRIFRYLHDVHIDYYRQAQQVEAADAHSFAKTQDTRHLHNMLSASCGFCLDVGDSAVSAESDGTIDGVYIRGKARAGTVVGFFPGVTYLRDRVHAGDFTARLDERGGRSDYVYMRSDRSLVDGSQRVGKLNPFALGHLIRHPSCGKPASLIAKPNVITFPFDYPSKDGKEPDVENITSYVETLSAEASNFFPTELRPYIPNAYSSPPGMLSPESAKESFAQGAVIVAVRDLEDGEEIFCDYRLNPKVPLPSWYCPVDAKKVEEFWGVDNDGEKGVENGNGKGKGEVNVGVGDQQKEGSK